jgi:predicted RNA methylase
MPELSKCLEKSGFSQQQKDFITARATALQGEGITPKEAAIQAVRALQAETLNSIRDVYTQIGIPGYEPGTQISNTSKTETNVKNEKSRTEESGEQTSIESGTEESGSQQAPEPEQESKPDIRPGKRGGRPATTTPTVTDDGGSRTDSGDQDTGGGQQQSDTGAGDITSIGTGNQGTGLYEGNIGGTGEGGIEQQPGKARRRLIRDEALKNEIDAAWDDFLKGSDLLTTGGLDPRRIEQGTKLIALYIKSGVYKFADILEDAYGKFGDNVRNLVDAMKAVYSAYYNTQATDEEAAQMDASVRGISIDDVINRVESSIPQPEPAEIDLPDNPTRRFVDSIKEALRNKEKLNIVALRKMAAEEGFGEVVDTTLQEMAELAIVELAREISLSPATRQERYDQLVELYDTQPTISMRSSERIDKQQYSTPIPMSFLMGEFVNQTDPTLVLEPSAGNGMLTIAIPPGKIIANELDPVRLSMLADQGFGMVTSQNATQPFPHQVDGVIMNPPFGKAPEKRYDGYRISGLDNQMIATALQSLKPNGRAAIIMGGHNRYDEFGVMEADRIFFNYLYSHYNVADVINVGGDLYAKQGTKFPVRIILINGVKTDKTGLAPLENKELNAPVESFEKLYERIQNTLQNENVTPSPDTVQPPMDAQSDDGAPVYVGPPSRSGTRSGKTRTNKPTSAQDQLLDSTGGKSRGETTPNDNGLAEHLSGDSNTGTRQPSSSDTNDRPLEERDPDVSQQPQPPIGDQPGRSGTTFPPSKPLPIPDRTIELLSDKAPYEPKSAGNRMANTVIPSQMATETYAALDAIEEIYGTKPCLLNRWMLLQWQSIS